jgi:hypothetical protein
MKHETLRAILLRADALLLEEAELNRGRRHEIRRGIVIRHHQSIHRRFSKSDALYADDVALVAHIGGQTRQRN